jgi:hypothetical protein
VLSTSPRNNHGLQAKTSNILLRTSNTLKEGNLS